MVYFRLINTSPFDIEEFFFNYSINIFKFFLSTNAVEEYFDVYDTETTLRIVNNEFVNRPMLQRHFQRVTHANVLSLYMAIVLEGLEHLPSVIGVPKPVIPNYKELLYAKDYLCIEFIHLIETSLESVCNHSYRGSMVIDKSRSRNDTT